MEYEIFLLGIGGQGVQLVGKVLALAALSEGLHAMITGAYGGAMRGGSSLGTLVLGTGRLHSLPITPAASSALVLHGKYWELIGSRMRPAALIVADAASVESVEAASGMPVISVAAAQIAAEVGNAMTMGLVLLGAYNAMTGLVSTDSLVAAMKELVPVYRRQHVEKNEQAIRAGAASVIALSHPVGLYTRRGAAA